MQWTHALLDLFFFCSLLEGPLLCEGSLRFHFSSSAFLSIFHLCPLWLLPRSGAQRRTSASEPVPPATRWGPSAELLGVKCGPGLQVSWWRVGGVLACLHRLLGVRRL